MDKLEEAIDKYSSGLLKKTIGEGFEINIDSCENAFRAGAKWQEEQSAGKEQDSMLAASLIGADLAKPKWISVKDKLPYMDKRFVLDDGVNTRTVLCVTKHGIYFADFMIKIRNFWGWNDGLKPVMWMPIPELPKGGEK